MAKKEKESTAVTLESGKKKVFACAVDWPGWSRGAAGEEAALEALLAYAPRYEKVLSAAKIDFSVPEDVSALRVTERVEGKAATDFGVPGVVPKGDYAALDEAGVKQLQDIMSACWEAFDATVKRARGKELRKGPRGGGREVEEIYAHVVESEEGYIAAAGGKLEREPGADARWQLEQARNAMLDTLAAGARGEIEERGPRGGRRWPPRYLARRAAWHILDHLWEIEDRLE
jgi:hypothetical protein